MNDISEDDMEDLIRVLCDAVCKTFPLIDMNRSELQDQLIQQIIDDMDIKTMAALLYDMMDESYDKYSENELIAEVEEYYPHILEE